MRPSHAETIENLVDASKTPDELIDQTFEELRATLADELLQQVKEMSDRFFERLVVELLVAMGCKQPVAAIYLGSAA